MHGPVHVVMIRSRSTESAGDERDYFDHTAGLGHKNSIDYDLEFNSG